MNRYNRNRIYVGEEEQEKVRETKILLGGAGIGSIIAECALRFGFEDIVIVDGDKVELTNLNRQNYENRDIGKYKAECLAKRLKRINPKANIQFHNAYIDKDNVRELLNGVKIAINALDFKSEIPFVFDELCSERKIPVLHPYNFGWGAFLTIVKPGSYQLKELSEEWSGFELKMAEFVARYCMFWNIPNRWLDEVIDAYKRESEGLPPPQLSIASWVVAGHCVNAIFDIITGKEVKYFPKFYFSSLRCDIT
ncbi:MAG: ThiF family adenylyltransferase [Muribaculaceae bacterium]|nr:ThiF family adenylyltransferase [Muribaculaceae bacterium]